MKMFNQVRKYGVGAALVSVTAPAFAGSPYASITAAVDWADVSTGIVAIAALIAAVLVVKRGSGMLLRMIGR
jgi:hypothetical protein